MHLIGMTVVVSSTVHPIGGDFQRHFPDPDGNGAVAETCFHTAAGRKDLQGLFRQGGGGDIPVGGFGAAQPVPDAAPHHICLMAAGFQHG